MADLISTPKNPFYNWIERCESQQWIADQLGVSRSMVNHWRWGREKPSIPMTKRIVELAGGQLTRADVRPDVYDE